MALVPAGQGFAMSEHEVSRVLTASSHDAFELCADLSRLPEWLPTVGVAEPGRQGLPAVHVEGESSRGRYESDGFWRPSPDQLRVEWGSLSRGAPEAYAGWLQVMDSAGGCEVVVHLSFFDRQAPAAVEADLARSLEALADLVER